MVVLLLPYRQAEAGRCSQEVHIFGQCVVEYAFMLALMHRGRDAAVDTCISIAKSLTGSTGRHGPACSSV
jgi:hypothetical protein